MTKRGIKLLHILDEKKTCSARELALLMNLSEKTIRNELKELREALPEYGACLAASPKTGFTLTVTDEDRFQSFLKHEEDSEEPAEQSGEREERINELLRIFLSNLDGYIRFEELEERMNLSRSSLTRELRIIRDILEQRNLTFENRPNYGLRLVGSEYDLRVCIADYLVKRELSRADAAESDELFLAILQALGEIRAELNLHMTNFSYENLVVHLYVALRRIKNHNEVTFTQDQIHDLKQRKEYAIALKIGDSLKEKTGLELPEAELGYITVHLAAKHTIFPQEGNRSCEISPTVQNLVQEILNEIYERYCLDFRNDLDLVMALCLHMVSLEVRIRFELELRNPIVEDIQQRFQLAFLITQTCVNEVIQEHYNRSLSEDEIAYLVLHINLALERMKNGHEKKNLLIISATGAGTSQMLKYEYERHFKDHIASILLADPHTVTQEQINRADYILTTTPLRLQTSKPVIQVHPLIQTRDLEQLQSVMDKSGELLEFFDTRLFFPDLKGETPQQVIREMVARIGTVEHLPPNFLDLVEQREQAGPTSFQTMAAFPHPIEPCVEHTFIAVGILRRPIRWNESKVSLIYLMALTKNTRNKESLPLLYRVTGQLLTDTRRIKDIVENKTFACLCKHVTELGKELEG